MLKGIRISLANKCQLLFGLAVVLVMTAALTVVGWRMQTLVEQAPERRAKDLAEMWLAEQITFGAPVQRIEENDDPAFTTGVVLTLIDEDELEPAAARDPFLDSAVQRFDQTPTAVDHFASSRDVDGQLTFRYARAVRASDVARMEGTFEAGLDAAGLADDTVVVFTSDHGDNLGSHGLMGKSQLNDESMRIPMLVAGPGVAAQVHTDSVASLVDVPTTFLSLAGQTRPDHFHGRNFAGVLGGDAPTAEPAHAIIESVSHGIGVRTPTHTLGVPWADLDAWQLADAPDQLFDVTQDEFELNNLIDDNDHQSLRDELHNLARSWHESLEPFTPPPVRVPR